MPAIAHDAAAFLTFWMCLRTTPIRQGWSLYRELESSKFKTRHGLAQGRKVAVL